MRKLLFTLILILAAYVGYQYYFGKEEDKSNARVIVQEAKDLGKAVGDLLKRQKEKYDDGEFNQVIDRVNNMLEKMKSTPAGDEEEVKDNLRQLENELRQIDPRKLNTENRKALEKILEDVNKELQ